MTPLLVIGYGNELRGDDGVGPRVARAVAEWNRPDIRGLAVHQLTPELAAELAKAECVIFVDAAVDTEGATGWRRLRSCSEPTRLGHANDPAWLLGLTQELYGRSPNAWLATIGARDLGYGSRLTLGSERGAEAVLRRISAWIEKPSRVTAV